MQNSLSRKQRGDEAMRGISALAGAVLAMLPIAAQAAETVTYTYDAKGRLVKVERSGSVNSGVDTEYQHDKADNRKRVKTTGAST
ncbi:hypothetical protein [Pelagerythrobacter rhizovicinus]|uniref:hypothetical protein n=1 Tax=Pelagerythrobacter rhizovicinus TaxID=2268576 RepID=UPI0010106E11|nr:hypothetical protein [Pelagerythrobacter rhizovicinus]